MRLHRAAPSELARTASARLTVDLDALAANYRLLADRAEHAACAAVVKADGYGLGAIHVAQRLFQEGCRTFFVAQLDEALDLCPELPGEAAIFVLNGLPPGSEPLCARAGIVPVLNSTGQARRWQALAEASSVPLPAAIQIDTGMSRLGFPAAEAEILSADARFRESVPVALVMSHLACADEPLHPANNAQRVRFRTVAAMFEGATRSLANSAGTLLWEAGGNDMVRCGIALYGGGPVSGQPNPMRPVATLEAQVIQLRTVIAGTGVGYGFAYHAPGTRRLATVSIGYADGWHRSLGGNSAVWFGGRRLPIVGRVSMDSIVVDVTPLGEGGVVEGDWVELIGPRQTIDEVARAAGTISYEILTRIGPRVDRVYRGGAAPGRAVRA